MRITKAQRILNLYGQMNRIGISDRDTEQLLRVERSLSRWFTLECGDSNDYASWAIERDETTNKPYMVRHLYGLGRVKARIVREPLPDRETGARKKLAAIMANYPDLVAYVQTDPRGCALYILTKEQIGNSEIDSVYTRGVAVCL